MSIRVPLLINNEIINPTDIPIFRVTEPRVRGNLALLADDLDRNQFNPGSTAYLLFDYAYGLSNLRPDWHIETEAIRRQYGAIRDGVHWEWHYNIETDDDHRILRDAMARGTADVAVHPAARNLFEYMITNQMLDLLEEVPYRFYIRYLMDQQTRRPYIQYPRLVFDIDPSRVDPEPIIGLDIYSAHNTGIVALLTAPRGNLNDTVFTLNNLDALRIQLRELDI